MNGGPSDKAMEAGKERSRVWDTLDPPAQIPAQAAVQIVIAAHDPALGPARSVCLQAVLDKLDRDAAALDAGSAAFVRAARQSIEHEFGGGS